MQSHVTYALMFGGSTETCPLFPWKAHSHFTFNSPFKHLKIQNLCASVHYISSYK